jgi:gluconokinase
MARGNADFIDRTRRAHGHAVVACSARARYAGQSVTAATSSDLSQGDTTLIVGRLTGRHGHFMPAELLNSQFEALEEPGTEENPVTVSIAEPPAAIVARIIARYEDECQLNKPFSQSSAALLSRKQTATGRDECH